MRKAGIRSFHIRPAKKLVVAVAIVGLALSSTPAALADPPTWQKDPDIVLDPGRITSVITQLLAPDPTIGDADTTDAGVGTDAVGIDDSLTAPPADPADADPGNTYVVDNTPLDGDCPQATFTTIQAAVTASGPGDTVKVCPGTYPEQVRITGHGHDKLKLESLKPLQATIQWPTIESSPLALVDFKNADGVTLRGFVIAGPFTFGSCSPDRHEGLLVESAFDEHIHHNHITMIRNSVPALRGCQEGDAVAVGRRTPGVTGTGTEPGSARVDHNLIDSYQKNGVQAVNNGTSVKADHNVVTGPGNTAQPYAAPNGVSVFRQAAAIIDHNAISANHWVTPLSTAVILDEAPPGSSRVDKNRIFDNDYGIETDSQNDLEISHNDVSNNLADAITLCGDSTQSCLPATGIVVQKNNVRNNGGSGILLLDADNNLLKSNDVDGNGTVGPDATDGIRVDINSTGNQILKNDMDNNVTHDCHDDSTGAGSGTPPTANTWQGDSGATQNRDGLCKNAVTTP